MAEKCEHHDRKLYARGVCKACYLREYHNRLKAQEESKQNTEANQSDAKLHSTVSISNHLNNKKDGASSSQTKET